MRAWDRNRCEKLALKTGFPVAPLLWRASILTINLRQDLGLTEPYPLPLAMALLNETRDGVRVEIGREMPDFRDPSTLALPECLTDQMKAEAIVEHVARVLLAPQGVTEREKRFFAAAFTRSYLEGYEAVGK